MKIIVSHDIDYISFLEHWRNLVIPKFVVRNFIEYGTGMINGMEVLRRYGDLFRNQYQNTIQQMAYDQGQGIPSTFFIAVNRGRDNLSYSLTTAKLWIDRIKRQGFDVGVHCIDFDNYEGIKTEYDTFNNTIGTDDFGSRVHYVKTNENTYSYLEKAGYRFDSTVYGVLKDPYRVGRMWEFPLHVMDSYTMNSPKHWQSRNLKEAIALTKMTIDQAYQMGIRYFNCLSHDIYFSDSYQTWKKWYEWMIGYFKSNGFEFVNYRMAMQEMEEEGF
jgi:hypothetical protein